jgi:hypothetical protein
VVVLLLFGPARESRELRLFRKKEVECVAFALGETVCFVGGGAHLRARTPRGCCNCELLCFQFSCCAAASRVISRCSLVEDALLALGCGPLSKLLGALPLTLDVKVRGGSGPAEASEILNYRMRAGHAACSAAACRCAIYVPATGSCGAGCILGAHGLLGLSLRISVRTRSREVQGPAALSRMHAALTANLAMVTPHSIVLDPLCGHGSLLRAAANVPCAQTVGCDIDPHAVTAAQASLAANSPELIIADVTCPGFRPAHIADAIISDLPFGMRCEQVCTMQGARSAFAPHLRGTLGPLLHLTSCVLHLARSVARPTARVVLWLPQPAELLERELWAQALEAAAVSTGFAVLDLIEELRSGRIKRAVCIFGPAANAPIVSAEIPAIRASIPAWMTPGSDQPDLNFEERLCVLCTRLTLAGFVIESAPTTAAQVAIRASRSLARRPQRVVTSSDDQSVEADFWRSSWAGDISSVQRMLSRGFDPNALDPLSGCTALVYAAGYGRTEVVELLLEHRALVDAPCSNREGALMRAARCGHIGAVHALLRYGADVLQCDAQMNTCLHHAAGHGHAHVLRVLVQSHPSARTLRNSSGDMAMHCAVRWGHTAAVKELLHAGSGLDSSWRQEEGADRLEPLRLAAKWGHLGVLALLADHARTESAGMLTECEIREALSISLHWKRSAAHAFLCGLIEDLAA